MDPLVSTQWLADHLGESDLRILDATWFLTGEKRDAAAEFAAAHIPGAAFFDIDAVSDPESALPTMLPPASQFAQQVGALGVGDGDRIVLYDNAPHRTAARAWWMFRSFGISAAILDGGFAKWRREGREIGTDAAVPVARTLTARFTSAELRNLAQMRANLVSRAEQIVDARSSTRFAGSEPEPRPGIEPGHIPGSVSLPYPEFFDRDGTWKDATALRALLVDTGIDIEGPVVTTCGSGITAAIPAFAMHLLGRRAALYDGSWSEWGAAPDTPKAKGAA